MNDCAFLGIKHNLKFICATDLFLLGDLYFECANCRKELVVDRLLFYMSIRGNYNKERKNRGT